MTAQIRSITGTDAFGLPYEEYVVPFATYQRAILRAAFLGFVIGAMLVLLILYGIHDVVVL